MSVSPLLHICFNINQYPDSDLHFYFPYRLKSLIIYQFTQESSLKIQKQFLLLCNILLGCISFIFTCIIITSINICISVLLRFKIGFPNFLTGNVVFIFQVVFPNFRNGDLLYGTCRSLLFCGNALLKN